MHKYLTFVQAGFASTSAVTQTESLPPVVREQAARTRATAYRSGSSIFFAPLSLREGHMREQLLV